MEASGGWEGEQGRPSKGRDCRWARKGSRANMNRNGASGQPWRKNINIYSGCGVCV